MIDSIAADDFDSAKTALKTTVATYMVAAESTVEEKIENADVGESESETKVE